MLKLKKYPETKFSKATNEDIVKIGLFWYPKTNFDNAVKDYNNKDIDYEEYFDKHWMGRSEIKNFIK